MLKGLTINIVALHAHAFVACLVAKTLKPAVLEYIGTLRELFFVHHRFPSSPGPSAQRSYLSALPRLGMDAKANTRSDVMHGLQRHTASGSARSVAGVKTCIYLMALCLN